MSQAARPPGRQAYMPCFKIKKEEYALFGLSQSQKKAKQKAKMLYSLDNTYRDVLNFERDPSKLKRGYGWYEHNAMIERRHSKPEYAALCERDNAVVPLFDYLYFALHRVQTPAVLAFIEPFGKCFTLVSGSRSGAYNAHVGAELDRM